MKYVVSGHLSLELIENEIRHWSDMKRVWERCEILEGDSLETVVFKLYFRESSVKNVSLAVREMRLAPSSFDSNAVSTVIRKSMIEDKELMLCARSLLDGNWKQVQSFT